MTKIPFTIAAVTLLTLPLPFLSYGEMKGSGGQQRHESQKLKKGAEGKTQPGSLDITGTHDTTPGEYAFTPVRRGHLKDAPDSDLVGQTVKTKDGKEAGTLEDLLMDTKTNKIEYGVLSAAGTKELIPIPWSSFKANREGGEIKLNLTKEQLAPMVKFDDAKDMSPDVKKVVHDMQRNMGDTTPNQEGLGITDKPAAGGSMGEEKAGGAGPSGPRAAPPGEAPGFEGAGKK